ncbi:MAG TPA: CDP-alcohol phosphatidyltransferase family protein [Rhodanobacteraceae bacterium]|nr:CDP-alcohol phosphatidyltransferase family protein [Rhodanobacteraceae bacterium]
MSDNPSASPLRHLPNAITCLRIALVVPLIVMVLQERFVVALIIGAIAGLSDGVDGFLARRFGWRSSLGALLDAIADKLMLVGVYLALASIGRIAFALAWLVVARDLIIVTGALLYRAIIGKFEAQPSLWSKATTLAQILFVLLVLGAACFGWHWSPHPYGWIVAVLTVISGADYIVRWSLRARDALRARSGR